MLYPTNTFSRICTNTSFRNWSFCCQGLHNQQFDHTHLNSCKTCLPRKIFRCTFTRTYPCCPNLHPLLIAESTSDERLISNTAFAESSLSWLVFRLHLDFLAEDMAVFPPSGERLGVFPSQRIPQWRQFVCCNSSCSGEAYKHQKPKKSHPIMNYTQPIFWHVGQHVQEPSVTIFSIPVCLQQHLSSGRHHQLPDPLTGSAGLL